MPDQRTGFRHNRHIVDRCLPFGYPDAMRPNEIIRLTRTYTWPADDSRWLVTFELAEIDGRLECVGMTVRSFVKRWRTEGYVAHVSAPEERDAFYGELEEVAPAGSAAWHDLFEAQYPLLAAWEKEDLVLPQPFKALMLRDLSPGSLLAQARRDEATAIYAQLEVELLPPLPTDVASDGSSLADEAEALKRRKPRSKYSDADVGKVAKLYRVFRNAGSRSPTTDVANELGYTRDVAAKLVARGRKRDLIEPAEQKVGKNKRKESRGDQDEK